MAGKSRAEEIRIFIRDQILTGRWEPGDRLNDLELSQEMEVSRLSVREALFRLIETGLVEKSHWKGYYLKKITENDIRDMIDLRLSLELLSIRNFIKEATAADFADMEQTINESEKLLQDGDLLKYLTHDYHFHEIGYTRQHNKYITKTLDNYLLYIQFIRYISMGKDENFIESARLSIIDHRAILSALKERNYEKTEALLKKHLLEHRDKTIDELSTHVSG